MLRWLAPAAMLALAPKCLLCLAAYTGAGAALAVKLGAPELCGAPAARPGGTHVLAWLALSGAGLGFVLVRRTRHRPAHSVAGTASAAGPRAATEENSGGPPHF